MRTVILGILLLASGCTDDRLAQTRGDAIDDDGSSGGDPAEAGPGGGDLVTGDPAVGDGTGDAAQRRWHVQTIDHGLGEANLTDLWGRSDGAVFAVGWDGTILTNRVSPANPAGAWVAMSSGTTEHLTGIWGVENGTRFGQSADADGEMFAVGWNGTLLHYHPNPDGLSQPSPDDGRWQMIAGPGVGGFVPRLKIDPYCPDFDGDGVADDGGGGSAGGPDGWWSRADSCTDVTTTGCDDNCRTVPNGTERPVADLDGDFAVNACWEAEDDGPDPTAFPPQEDSDGDGLGTSCDSSGSADPVDTFAPTLFDVWAMTTSDGGVRVVAVGAGGAIVTYEGPDGSVEPSPPSRGLSDRLAWVVQQGLPYRFATDCHLTAPGTPPGQNCAESDRLPPACPAQCNPYWEACDCAGPCCVTGTGARLVGAACDGPTCGARQGLPAGNGCGYDAGAPGRCSTRCPDCFRRLSATLRSVAANGSRAVAVGAGGLVVQIDLSTFDVTDVWIRPECATLPSPLDEQPLLTAVSEAQGGFHFVGFGTVAALEPGAKCELAVRCGAPRVFLSDVASTGADRGYAVGDAGTLFVFEGTSTDCVTDPPVGQVDTGVSANLFAVWPTDDADLWLAGASGTLLHVAHW
jgi:hypothetical protein